MAKHPSAGSACRIEYVESTRTTLHTLKTWAIAGERYDVFTCCDPAAAHWLCLGGARVLLVGNSAVKRVLGLESSDTVPLGIMAAVGAAISRVARNAFVIVEYPGELSGAVSEHVGQIQQLSRESKAAAIKLDGCAEHLQRALVSPALATTPIVAHLTTQKADLINSDDQSTAECTNRSDAGTLTIDALLSVINAGAVAIHLESLELDVAEALVKKVRQLHRGMPIFGYNTGDVCPGRVHLLNDELGLRIDEASSCGRGVELCGIVRHCLEPQPKTRP